VRFRNNAAGAKVPNPKFLAIGAKFSRHFIGSSSDEDVEVPALHNIRDCFAAGGPPLWFQLCVFNRLTMIELRRHIRYVHP
jgi:hypothetical protein